MTKTLTATDYFNNEYIDFSVYDNVRKIASYVDGLKNAQRKVIYTLLETNCDSFIKVSNLGPRIQDFSQYLHGSLEGSVVNMTQDYVASGNNMTYLIGDGNFGTRFIQSPAASRYIFAKTNPMVKKVFKKEDNVNLAPQVFEGDKIEPRFYMPTIPTILINQSEGMSIGFAQKILPRDPKELIKWVEQKASGKRLTAKLTPHWVGQDFTVEQGDTNTQWVITGNFERLSTTKIRVDSLPIGYDLKGYHKVLDKLVDDKVIKDYDDLSDNDEFCFGLDVTREFSKKTDEQIIDVLKLRKRISENYTCVDANNKIVQFNSVKEILEAWWEVRLVFNQERKNYLIESIDKKVNDATIKQTFIQGVLDEAIELRGASESSVEKQANSYNAILEGHVKELLRLPMRHLTKEEVAKLKKSIADLKKERKQISDMAVEDFSLQDVAELRG